METNEGLEKSSTTALWSLEDDTFFHAQGLLNHAGCGQYVFVTWNESYLLNFVFNASFSVRSGTDAASGSSSRTNLGRSTLAKVRVMMPQYPVTEPNSKPEADQCEKIEQVLILEYNTLLLMHSGRVYYFSSVKSVHLVSWLKNVRCMAKGSHSTFSVIRYSESNLMNANAMGKTCYKLHLENYRDIPNLGKSTTPQKLLLHSYNITFDENNLFACSWMDERYLLNSFVVNSENQLLFSKLAQLDQNFIKNNTITVKSNDQKDDLLIKDRVEVYLFSISCNLYMLCGEEFRKNKASDTNIAQTFDEHSTDYSIHLINLYQSPIKSFQVEENEELIIVLLESGYLDLWYSSQMLQGALTHRMVQILPYLQFDYCSLQRSFYFVSFNRVMQLQIIREQSECRVQETHKTLVGMVACTWVEELQQLVCLSCNNIFYRLTFNNLSVTKRKEKRASITSPIISNDSVRNYELLKNVHALTNTRICNLIKKKLILSNLLKEPKKLAEKMKLEHQKQLLLSVAQNIKVMEKLLSSHIEYHLSTSRVEYAKKYPNIFFMNIEFNNCEKALLERNAESIIEYNALVFIKISERLFNSKRSALLAIFFSNHWCLQIFSKQQSILVPLFICNLEKKICLILKCLTNCDLQKPNKPPLERFQLRLLSIVNHLRSHLLIEFPVEVEYFHSERLEHLFSSNNILYTINDKKLNKGETNWNCPNVGNTYKHEICLANVRDLKRIFKGFSASSTNGKLFYFLGLIPFKVDHSESGNFITISSDNPAVIFYFKVHCLLTLKDGDNPNSNYLESNNLVDTLLRSQCKIERLYGLLTNAKLNNNSSTIHWETLKKVYHNLRTIALNQIYR